MNQPNRPSGSGLFVVFAFLSLNLLESLFLRRALLARSPSDPENPCGRGTSMEGLKDIVEGGGGKIVVEYICNQAGEIKLPTF